MSSSTTPLLVKQKPSTKGEFAPAPPDASRSPCPVVNALANHGYIERSGKCIYMNDLNASMSHVGMSSLLGSIFAKPTYIEFQDPAKAQFRKPVGFFTKLWQLIKNPYSFFSYFGCWKAGQEIDGKRFINLIDLATHGAIEHDISLTRHDIGEKEGNNDVDQKLVSDLLSSSSDGGKTLTTDDLGAFIKRRIEQQLAANPNAVYNAQGHQVNCGQVALMMNCFGDGKSVPCSYVKAIFADERLPWKEGWKKRSWWHSMGVFEFFGAVQTMQKAVGITI